MVCAHTDTIYKEWLIPPKYNGLLLMLFSQTTTLVCQVSSCYLTSLPLSVPLVVTTQYPRLRECHVLERGRGGPPRAGGPEGSG